MLHNFKTDLAFSDAASDEDFWWDIYKAAFVDLVDWAKCQGDNAGQRAGVDRVIVLSNGKTLTIDEKKRRDNWNDVLLEYGSFRDGKKVLEGWINKPLVIDYLAYAFMPRRTAILLPWNLLQAAWKKNSEAWLLNPSYKKVKAMNRNYTTHSVAVPIQELRKAINSAMVIRI